MERKNSDFISCFDLFCFHLDVVFVIAVRDYLNAFDMDAGKELALG